MASVWAYCRVSTRKEEQEDSLDTQRERAAAFADERSLELRLFVEQASAKSITGRPILTSLLSELESLPLRQRPTYMYVTAHDRLARDMADMMYVGRMLRSLKVTLFVYGRGEVRLDTFAERAMFVGESMGGDAENEAKSKRARDSWERRRREGKPTSNKVPYGLQLQGERDVPVPDSAEWVRKAFELYEQGHGAHKIGKLMAINAPPHRWLTTRVGEDGCRIEKIRAGTRWESLRVTKLLRQSRYRGTIVEPGLFDAVALRLANTPKPGSRRRREYPLSGAMRCETCGRHLHGKCSGTSRSKYLVDGTRRVYESTAIRYYECVVCRYMVNAKRVEDQFFADIGTLSGDAALLRRWVDVPRGRTSAAVKSNKNEAKKLAQELSQEVVQAQRDKMFSLALTASIDEVEFKRQMNRLDVEYAAKRARLAALQSTVASDEKRDKNVEHAAKLLSRFGELYEAASYEEKRELLSALAEALGGLTVSRAGLQWRTTLPGKSRWNNATPNAVTETHDTQSTS